MHYMAQIALDRAGREVKGLLKSKQLDVKAVIGMEERVREIMLLLPKMRLQTLSELNLATTYEMRVRGRLKSKCKHSKTTDFIPQYGVLCKDCGQGVDRFDGESQ